MKILFISEYILDPKQGAYENTKSNYKAICNIVGKENVTVVALNSERNIVHSSFITYQSYSSLIGRISNILQGNVSVINNKIIKEILTLIDNGNFDTVYFDNSYYGRLARKIKKRYISIKLVVFFHDIMFEFAVQHMKLGLFKRFPEFITMIYNEWLSTKYCDKKIVLNDRENNNLYKYYHIKADILLPVCYEDQVDDFYFKETQKDTGEFRLLFVGGYQWANNRGIEWFITNVFPNLDSNIYLYIAGRNMVRLDKEKHFSDNPYIIVVSNPDMEELKRLYASANVVIAPIFNGAGMKTKTAEALMYGKAYLASSEALCGYENLQRCLCNTKEDFISRINSYYYNNVDKFIDTNRQIYLKLYSVEAKENRLKDIFI